MNHPPRIALLGFSIDCNRFASVATEADLQTRMLIAGAARIVVVKSHGHFRSGFDKFFRHEQVIEVDAPGLTNPVLSRFPWRHMPHPARAIDDHAEWTPPA